MTEKIDNASEAAKGLKLTFRVLLLIVLASLIWHYPAESAWIRYPLGVVAAFVSIYALTGLILSATVWRNLICRLLGVTVATLTVRSLSAAFLLLLGGASVAVFFLIGDLVHG